MSIKGVSRAPLRIAAFGFFRSYPPHAKAAQVLTNSRKSSCPGLRRGGHDVIAYNRVYPQMEPEERLDELDGVKIRSFRTVSSRGFDTIIHSTKVTFDIIRYNRADIIHIQNGGNSIFGAALRLFGKKKTFLSQDGLDWERDKWPWYAKLYLFLSSFLTAHVHSAVIFDNVFFAREAFTKRFNKEFDFIPFFGADVDYEREDSLPEILTQLDIRPGGEYFLFVGRFIPDKGLHWLVPAFESLETNKKSWCSSVGHRTPSPYEADIRRTADPRIIFAGFLYGPDVHRLMKNAYAYVQPSAIEGALARNPRGSLSRRSDHLCGHTTEPIRYGRTRTVL